VLADLPERFRAACHWVLFTESVLGDEGLPRVSVTPGAPMSQRIGEQRVMADRLRIQSLVFPDGD
jgi:hypothetical protein